ncbi:hypothetical protein IFR05_010327 [Cadophora sp. M221]|nr:hypothetical protein IFR05_010327 [Cadophora sp. M221]
MLPLPCDSMRQLLPENLSRIGSDGKGSAQGEGCQEEDLDWAWPGLEGGHGRRGFSDATTRTRTRCDADSMQSSCAQVQKAFALVGFTFEST